MNYLDKSFQAVSKAIHHFSSRPSIVNVFLPLKPTYAYDLIAIVFVDGKEFYERVKVIQTESKSPSGSYVVNLRKSGGYHNSKEHKAPFDAAKCDCLFVCSPDGNYLIPCDKIHQTRAISLSMFEDCRCTNPS